MGIAQNQTSLAALSILLGARMSGPTKSPRVNILSEKRGRRGWGWSCRVKQSRYTGAKLRTIRKYEQARECERRYVQAFVTWANKNDGPELF